MVARSLTPDTFLVPGLPVILAALVGNDVLDGRGCSDALVGSGGDDYLNGGGGGEDLLLGDAVADTLDAGVGADNEATGGAGADTFVVNLTRVGDLSPEEPLGTTDLFGVTTTDFATTGDEAGVLQIVLDDTDSGADITVERVGTSGDMQVLLSWDGAQVVVATVTDGFTNGFGLDNIVLVQA